VRPKRVSLKGPATHRSGVSSGQVGSASVRARRCRRQSRGCPSTAPAPGGQRCGSLLQQFCSAPVAGQLPQRRAAAGRGTTAAGQRAQPGARPVAERCAWRRLPARAGRRAGCRTCRGSCRTRARRRTARTCTSRTSSSPPATTPRTSRSRPASARRPARAACAGASAAGASCASTARSSSSSWSACPGAARRSCATS